MSAYDFFDEDSLFAEAPVPQAPLAVRMRPRTLDDVVGQRQAVGPGSWLRSIIERDVLSSFVLFGPAGVGKTSLARVVAETTSAEFVEVSAVGGTVADLRREVEAAAKRLREEGRHTVLFVDEIHRFSKSQQDALLHAVEDRTVVLIGATTENPYFEVNSALLSRSRIVELRVLSDADVEELARRALADERGLAGRYSIDEEAMGLLVKTSGGDGRAALTTLELAAQLADGADKESIGPEEVSLASPRRVQKYDKAGDNHYDVVSAFIKSMRGSDPDATVYWLARMLEGGEDPKFIARRIMICASEDVGNADPQALLVAEAAFKACECIGMPECRINLSQAAIYVALAPKSNASYMAINAAMDDVRNGPAREVPSHLRDRHRPGSENYGKYKYPHDYPDAEVPQQYLPDGLARGAFWHPTDRG